MLCVLSSDSYSHSSKHYLFWSDVSTDVIKMSFMNGTGLKTVVKYGLESPSGLAVDWIHDLIFWTDAGTRRVEVSSFDGALRAVVAANDLDKPRAIVVHPGEALIFWTDWGRSFFGRLGIFSFFIEKYVTTRNRYNEHSTKSEN